MAQQAFKSYLKDKQALPTLKSKNKAIQYLEDIDASRFLEVLKSLKSKVITEKMDGTSFKFGFDNNGKFFTTRSGKGNADKIFYKAADWGISAASNGFKAAHLAIKEHQSDLKEVMLPGEAVDIEILYGRQPNTVVYGLDGTNYIMLIKMAEGTDGDIANPEKIDEIAKILKSKESSVTTINVDTVDGETLTSNKTISKWKFDRPNVIKPNEFSAQTKKLIAGLESFLKKKNEKLSELLSEEKSNLDASTFNLVSAGDHKEEIKRIREEVLEALSNKKKAIANSALSDLITDLKPKFQDSNVDENEDFGIEGVVILDTNTQEQFKLVDKNTFATINRFNFQVRDTIRGMVKDDNDESTLEQRGGILGNAKLRISRLFNVPGLGKTYTIKKVISKFKGESPEETVKNFAKTVQNADFLAFREKILSVIDFTLDELATALANFKENANEYQIELDTGKVVKYTEEVIHRTLLVFAEAKESLVLLSKKIKSAKSMEDLVIALYGKQIKQIHGDTPLYGEDAIFEDGDGGDASVSVETSPATPISVATTSSMIAPYPVRLFKNSMIRRITKTVEKTKQKKKPKKSS